MFLWKVAYNTFRFLKTACNYNKFEHISYNLVYLFKHKHNKLLFLQITSNLQLPPICTNVTDFIKPQGLNAGVLESLQNISMLKPDSLRL